MIIINTCNHKDSLQRLIMWFINVYSELLSCQKQGKAQNKEGYHQKKKKKKKKLYKYFLFKKMTYSFTNINVYAVLITPCSYKIKSAKKSTIFLDCPCIKIMSKSYKIKLHFIKQWYQLPRV